MWRIFCNADDGSGGGGTPAPTPAPTPEPGKSTVTFTQEDVTRIVAEDRRRYAAENEGKQTENVRKLQEKMQELAQSKSLTDVERADLEAALGLTRSEKEKSEALVKQTSEKLTAAEKRAAENEKRYVELAIGRALMDAAAPKAVTPAAAKLISKIINETATVDEHGTVTVKMMVTEQDGTKSEKELTPDQAVAILEAQPAEYGSLFKATATGGGGGKGTDGMRRMNDGSLDVSQLTMEQYMKLRKENPAALQR